MCLHCSRKHVRIYTSPIQMRRITSPPPICITPNPKKVIHVPPHPRARTCSFVKDLLVCYVSVTFFLYAQNWDLSLGCYLFELYITNPFVHVHNEGCIHVKLFFFISIGYAVHSCYFFCHRSAAALIRPQRIGCSFALNVKPNAFVPFHIETEKTWIGYVAYEFDLSWCSGTVTCSH